jgi:HK97 family phage major capsid protein
MMNQFIEFARAGRAYANLVPTEQLPPGTNSINIPKVQTGTAAGIQTADNANPAAANETDLTDSSVQANVKTIWGQQGLSIQLLEQSPIAFDQIVFQDLANAYAASLDVQVISGSGSSGQVVGVRNTSGITTVTATSASTDLANGMVAYKAIANAIAQVHTSRFLAPEVIVMHPRRWAAFLSIFGSDDRPLIAPNGNAFNQVGTLDAVASQRVVGGMQGLPVVTDPNLPINLGSGTNQDVIHVLRASDLRLFESSTRARALQETRASTLTVLLQLYGYLAFTAARYPASVVEVGGTALTTPQFA